MDLLTPMMVAALLVSGMGVAILGSVKVALANRLRMDEARVGALVSLFGFAMIPTMLVVGFFTDAVDKQIILKAGLLLITLPRGAETALILVLGVAAIGILGLMMMTRKSTTAMALVGIAGFVFGPIFGILVAVLFGHVEPAGRGRAVGLLFAIGGVGWTTIPILIGNYAQRTSLQRALVLIVAAAAGLSAVAAALLFAAGR